jgi:PTS system mannose-specific IIC component
MMAALGMGILLSFLMKKAWHFCLFLLGFVLVVYFGLNIMAVAIVATIAAVIYYTAIISKDNKSIGEGA